MLHTLFNKVTFYVRPKLHKNAQVQLVHKMFTSAKSHVFFTNITNSKRVNAQLHIHIHQCLLGDWMGIQPVKSCYSIAISFPVGHPAKITE